MRFVGQPVPEFMGAPDGIGVREPGAGGLQFIAEGPAKSAELQRQIERLVRFQNLPDGITLFRHGGPCPRDAAALRSAELAGAELPPHEGEDRERESAEYRKDGPRIHEGLFGRDCFWICSATIVASSSCTCAESLRFLLCK